jgi:RimJ/RimL family protein N-acetyltransferase
MKTKLVEYNKIFLDLSWKWLNDKEIRKLTDTPQITRNDQLKWFNSLNEKEDYLIWGIEYDGIAIGACGLKNLTNTNAEYWGYIGEKDFWGKKIGSDIMTLIEMKANKLNLSLLWLKVIPDNTRAINLYRKFGFQEISLNEKIIIMEKHYDKIS